MLNHTILVGRVVRTPELRKTQDGRDVSNLTLAIARPFKNQATEEYESDFITVSTWETNARNVAKYVNKGSIIGVKGRLVHRSYELPGGKTIRAVEVMGERISFIQNRRASASPSVPESGMAARTAPPAPGHQPKIVHARPDFQAAPPPQGEQHQAAHARQDFTTAAPPQGDQPQAVHIREDFPAQPPAPADQSQLIHAQEDFPPEPPAQAEFPKGYPIQMDLPFEDLLAAEAGPDNDHLLEEVHFEAVGV